MSRRPLLVAGLTLLFTVACARVQVERAGDADAPSVRGIQSVYLGDFRRTADGLEARASLRAEIERRGLFTVVESPDEADGIIDGAVNVRGPVVRFDMNGAVGEARLVDRASGRLIWRHRFVMSRQAPYPLPPGPEGAIYWIVSQFCDELEMSAARGGGA